MTRLVPPRLLHGGVRYVPAAAYEELEAALREKGRELVGIRFDAECAAEGYAGINDEVSAVFARIAERAALSAAGEKEDRSYIRNGAVKCECGHQRSWHSGDVTCAVCACTGFVRSESDNQEKE